MGRDGQQRRSERLGRRRGRSRAIRARYRTPDGYEAFTTRTAEIAVAGGATRANRNARHALGSRHRGGLARPAARAARDVARAAGARPRHRGRLGRHRRRERERALARWAGPSLNWVLADRDGAIAWVVNGPLPRRVGFDGSRPESLADGSRSWQGRLPPPGALGGRDGALFTANNRTLPRERADAVSRMWMRPLRAKRIDDLLAAQPHVRRARLPRDAARHARRRLRADPRHDSRSSRAERTRAAAAASARARASDWNGHADVDQPAFRILHAYYRALLERTLEPLLTPAIAADASFVYRWPLADEVLRRLLDERPAHLLTSEHADWHAFLRAVLLETLTAIDARRRARRAVGRGQRARRRPSVRRHLGAARGPARRCRARRCRARWYRCEWRRRATAPCCEWPSRLARRKTACSSSRAARAATSCRRSFATSQAGVARRSADAVPRRRARRSLHARAVTSRSPLYSKHALLDRRPLRIGEVRMHGPDLVADGRGRRRLTRERGDAGALRRRPIVVARERDERGLRRTIARRDEPAVRGPARCRLGRRRVP